MTKRVLVVANDHVGKTMAGPGIRAYRMAVELSADFDVTLVAPFATDLRPTSVEIVQDDPWDDHRMSARVRAFDAVVTQRLPVPTMRRLARTGVMTIYDLYDPSGLEALALAAAMPPTRRIDATHRLEAILQEAALACGDAFICASERQRDFWLGSLITIGRVDRDAYVQDPSLRKVIDVVPFGIEPSRPRRNGPAIKGVVPGIGADDKVLLWGGGVWNWLDPLTIIRAVARISERRSDVKLFFLGLEHPNPTIATMPMERQAFALAEELGVRDRFVFFNRAWVPYEQRGSYYLDADVGVSAHFDNLETRFSFRTRLLDYFWAGLPVITTRGDVLGDLVAERGLGRTPEPESIDAWEAAIEQLLDDEGERDAVRRNLGEVRGEFAWSRVVGPLRSLLAAEAQIRSGPPADLTLRYMGARLEHAYRQHGARQATARLTRHLLRRPKPLSERARPGYGSPQ